MEIQGKIIATLPERSGETSRGKWVSQDYVLETTNEKYPKKVCFAVFGAERIQRFNLSQNHEYVIKFDIDAHEWQGKWYNQVTAFDAREVGAQQPTHTNPLSPDPTKGETMEDTNDLPF